MDTCKAQPGRSRARKKLDMEKVRKEKIRDGESQKRQDAGAQKGRKVGKHYVFPLVCGSGGSKSRLAKATGAEPASQMKYGKLHAVLARSTCASENVQSTRFSEHFWKVRCGKSARPCRSKHIWK